MQNQAKRIDEPAAALPPAGSRADEPRVRGCWFRVTNRHPRQRTWVNATRLIVVSEQRMGSGGIIGTLMELEGGARVSATERIDEVLQLIWQTRELGSGDAAGMTAEQLFGGDDNPERALSDGN